MRATKRDTVSSWQQTPPCVLLLVLAVIFFSTPAFASVVKPTIPEASGERCVEDTPVIRRNHMDYLDHQRDKTMREGMRKPKYSLNRCLTCHAVTGVDGQPVTAKSEKHFCNSCHAYAAVRIDCFDCHASTPGDEKALAGKDL